MMPGGKPAVISTHVIIILIKYRFTNNDRSEYDRSNITLQKIPVMTPIQLKNTISPDL